MRGTFTVLFETINSGAGVLNLVCYYVVQQYANFLVSSFALRRNLRGWRRASFV